VERITPILLLVVSNLFMTYAWYGHLKDLRTAPLSSAILVSWLVAGLEYCFQVPANRMGLAAGYKVAELKTLQELITLVVFVGFAVLYLGETLRWNHAVGFALVALGALFVFKPW
jgi:hypothetical protein